MVIYDHLSVNSRRRDICQLLNREGTGDNVLGQGLPPPIIISSNSYPVMDTKARMPPAHDPID